MLVHKTQCDPSIHCFSVSHSSSVKGLTNWSWKDLRASKHWSVKFSTVPSAHPEIQATSVTEAPFPYWPIPYKVTASWISTGACGTLDLFENTGWFWINWTRKRKTRGETWSMSMNRSDGADLDHKQIPRLGANCQPWELGSMPEDSKLSEEQKEWQNLERDHSSNPTEWTCSVKP